MADNEGYADTFIAISPDSLATVGKVPKPRGSRETIAQIEHDLLSLEPYTHTQKDMIFATHLRRKSLHAASTKEKSLIWDELFSRPHPCMRCSPLSKTYGWGIHYDSTGRIGIVAVESDRYNELISDRSLNQTVGMRSTRKPKNAG